MIKFVLPVNKTVICSALMMMTVAKSNNKCDTCDTSKKKPDLKICTDQWTACEINGKCGGGGFFFVSEGYAFMGKDLTNHSLLRLFNFFKTSSQMFKLLLSLKMY